MNKLKFVSQRVWYKTTHSIKIIGSPSEPHKCYWVGYVIFSLRYQYETLFFLTVMQSLEERVSSVLLCVKMATEWQILLLTMLPVIQLNN